MRELKEILSQYVNLDKISFVTTSNQSTSSDLDVYCVVEDSVPSSVHIFEEDGLWYELFIDNKSDVTQKISNVDEIIVNFLLEMEFSFGDTESFAGFKLIAEDVKKNYAIPEDRRNKIVYRIKVLSSKLFNPAVNNTKDQSKFLVNSLTYSLVQLILEKHGLFPSSPKRWFIQLEEGLSSDEYDLIKELISEEPDLGKIKMIIEIYAGKLHRIDLDKSTNNSITFIT